MANGEKNDQPSKPSKPVETGLKNQKAFSDYIQILREINAAPSVIEAAERSALTANTKKP